MVKKHLIIIGALIVILIISISYNLPDDSSLKSKFYTAINNYHHDWDNTHISIGDYSNLNETIYSVYYSVNGTNYLGTIKLHPVCITDTGVVT